MPSTKIELRCSIGLGCVLARGRVLESGWPQAYDARSGYRRDERSSLHVCRSSSARKISRASSAKAPAAPASVSIGLVQNVTRQHEHSRMVIAAGKMPPHRPAARCTGCDEPVWDVGVVTAKPINAHGAPSAVCGICATRSSIRGGSGRRALRVSYCWQRARREAEEAQERI